MAIIASNSIAVLVDSRTRAIAAARSATLYVDGKFARRA